MDREIYHGIREVVNLIKNRSTMPKMTKSFWLELNKDALKKALKDESYRAFIMGKEFDDAAYIDDLWNSYGTSSAMGKRETVEDGGPGSGNFGHEGRPGKVGGSASTGASLTKESAKAAEATSASTYSYKRKEAAKKTWVQPQMQIHKRLIEDTKKVWKELTQEEKNGIFQYTTEENNSPMNKALRTEAYQNKTADPEIAAYIDGATNALNKVSLPEDTWLERGVDSKKMGRTLQVSQDMISKATYDPYVLEMLRKKCIGKVIHQSVFLSSCPKKGMGYIGHKIEMFAPAGSKVLYVEPFSDYGGPDGLSWNGRDYPVSSEKDFGEFETIVQRDSDLLIKDISVINHKLHVEADLITH